MNYWRMSMRRDIHGTDWWEACFERGIAALEYWPDGKRTTIQDCAKLTPEEYDEICRARDRWHNTALRHALRCVAYEMRPGDTIYARSAPDIVGKGVVTEGYRYDPDILKGTGCDWRHFVRVEWERLPPFKSSIQPHPPTLLRLVGTKLEQMQAAEAAARRAAPTRDGVQRTSDYGVAAEAVAAALARRQGFAGNPATRKAVEAYAMRLAIEHFRHAGYDVEDVSASRPYDLHCSRGEETLHVEVKGTQGTGEEVLLTPNEVAFARAHGDSMALFLVTGVEPRNGRGGCVCSGGESRIIQSWDIGTGTLRPTGYAWECPE